MPLFILCIVFDYLNKKSNKNKFLWIHFRERSYFKLFVYSFSFRWFITFRIYLCEFDMKILKIQGKNHFLIKNNIEILLQNFDTSFQWIQLIFFSYQFFIAFKNK